MHGTVMNGAGDDGGIAATGLKRTFGPVQAVADIDFTAPAGEVTALIGPNGSGKTTLLLMLASLLRPDAGTISVCGLDPLTDPRGVRALLGWMPDTLGVWEALTAREILTTVGRLYGAKTAAAAARADELLELVKLGPLARQPARVLSRGQQQRLSLARALVNDPRVLLLDEPASGLDPGARVDLRTTLRNLAAEGRTVVVSSHVLSELDEMADRAVFVSAGRTVRSQSVAEAGEQDRRYAVQATDGPALASALRALGVPFQVPGGQRRFEAEIRVGSETEAAALLRRLVEEGVPVAAFGPASGALEETYLSLREAER
ncbi:ABC transporter ATP-binding protein [Arthrobacter ginkgonis]|uniref:ABC transporter ATP-binding protein n=1 Tax=Arthrobacter ginkgonis TaxID=1630594 RepID=A0ABP7BWC6_9MICC